MAEGSETRGGRRRRALQRDSRVSHVQPIYCTISIYSTCHASQALKSVENNPPVTRHETATSRRAPLVGRNPTP